MATAEWYDPQGADLVRALIAPPAPPGGSFPDFTGSGSPEGVITAAVGKSYVDTANGALWFKISGAGNTGWMGFGFDIDGGLSGLIGPANGNAVITDVLAATNTGNGIAFLSNGTDGQQVAYVCLGSNGQFVTRFNADGSTEFPGPVSAGKINGGGYSLELTGDGGGGGVLLGDEFLDSGAGNCIEFQGDGIDGHQYARIVLGGPDAFVETHFKPDGTTEFPGNIVGPTGVFGIYDQDGVAGTGNGIELVSTGTDGEQHVRINLGPGSEFGTQFRADGATWFPGDATFPAGKGPVIHDDTDGHTYRIGSHNGAVTLTQVT